MFDPGAGLVSKRPWTGVLAVRLPVQVNESFVVVVVVTEHVKPLGLTICPLDTCRFPGTTILKPVVGWSNPICQLTVGLVPGVNWPNPIPLNGGSAISTKTSKK